MLTSAKIALTIPNADRPGRYFAFPLQASFQTEACQYRMPPKLFAISGIKGHFQRLAKLLMVCGVIDKYFNWTFDDGHLVVLGNCFATKEAGIECLWFLYSLEEKAKKEGGHVHFILGKEEIDNLPGDWRYQHPPYASLLSNTRQPAALYTANHELWRWLQTKHIMERIGHLLFVTGGISPAVNRLKQSITSLNREARTCYLHPYPSLAAPLLHTLYHHEDSPFRYSGFYDGRATETQIATTLKKFRVRKIITGAIAFETINCHMNGQLINIATHHSQENSEGLMIRKGRIYRVDRQGHKERITDRL